MWKYVLLWSMVLTILPMYRTTDITEEEATTRWVECCHVCAESIDDGRITSKTALINISSSNDYITLLDNVINVKLTHSTDEVCSFNYTINNNATNSMPSKLVGQQRRPSHRPMPTEFNSSISLPPFYNATIDINDPQVINQTINQARNVCEAKSKDYICTQICQSKYDDQGNDWTCATDLTWDVTIDTIMTSTLDKYAASLVQVDRSAIVPSGQVTRGTALGSGMTLALDRIENINIEGQMGAKEHGIVTVNATVLVYNFICGDFDCSYIWGVHMSPSKSFALIAPFRIGDAQYFAGWTQQGNKSCYQMNCSDPQKSYFRTERPIKNPVQVLMEDNTFERGREARPPYATIPLLLQFGAYRIQQSNISWSLIDPNAAIFPPFYFDSYVAYVSNASDLDTLMEKIDNTAVEKVPFDVCLNPNYNKVYIMNNIVLEQIQSNHNKPNRSSFENSIHTVLNNRDSYPIEAIFGSERIQDTLHGTLNCKQYYYQSRSDTLTANFVTVAVLLVTAVINFIVQRNAGGQQHGWLVGDKPPTIIDLIANWAAITPIILYAGMTMRCINNNGGIGCGGHPTPVNLMVWGLKPYHSATANELPNGRAYVGDVYLNMSCIARSTDVAEKQRVDKIFAIVTFIIGGFAIIARLVHTLMRIFDGKKDSSNNIKETSEYQTTYKAIEDYYKENSNNSAVGTPNETHASEQPPASNNDTVGTPDKAHAGEQPPATPSGQLKRPNTATSTPGTPT